MSKKTMTAMFTCVAMMCSIGSVSSYAKDNTDVAYEEAMEQLEELRMSSQRQTVYFPEYTSYSSQYICANAHYMAAFNPFSLPSRTVDLYMNLNVTTNSPASTNNYLTFSSDVDVDSVSYQYSTSVYKYYRPHVGINGTLAAYSTVFSFNMGVVGGADSEAELLSYTGQDPNSPDTTIRTSQNEYLKKCIYAIGDTNRDGKLTADDSSLIMNYIVGNAVPDSNRSTADKIYDTMAFKLAADVDHSDSIDILDVISINSAISNNTILY